MKELKYKVGDRVRYISHKENCTIAAIRDHSFPYIVSYAKGWPGGSNNGKLLSGQLNIVNNYHYVEETNLSLIQAAEPQVINEYQIF